METVKEASESVTWKKHFGFHLLPKTRKCKLENAVLFIQMQIPGWFCASLLHESAFMMKTGPRTQMRSEPLETENAFVQAQQKTASNAASIDPI